MKMPIKWHEECLVNSANSLARAEFELSRKIADVSMKRANYEFSALQLQKAKDKGIDGYDNERFLKNMKP